jgi:polyisoprenoid-binding protein YceI
MAACQFGGSVPEHRTGPSQGGADALPIQASSIQTGNPRRNAPLRAKFLNIDNHPTITFTSTDVQQVGRTTFKVTGDLAIRGVTAPVAVDFELTEVENDRLGNVEIRFVGRATVNRKDWGVHWNAAMGWSARR